eukprot:351882-Chlamydomonas_euryale.AAC.12
MQHNPYEISQPLRPSGGLYLARQCASSFVCPPLRSKPQAFVLTSEECHYTSRPSAGLTAALDDSACFQMSEFSGSEGVEAVDHPRASALRALPMSRRKL